MKHKNKHKINQSIKTLKARTCGDGHFWKLRTKDRVGHFRKVTPGTAKEPGFQRANPSLWEVRVDLLCSHRPPQAGAIQGHTEFGMLYEMWGRKSSKQDARGGCNLENRHLAQVPLNTKQKHSKTFTYSILNVFSLSQRNSISGKKKTKKMNLVNGDDSKPTIHLKTPEHTFHSKERWTIRTGTKGVDTLGGSAPRAAAGEE